MTAPSSMLPGSTAPAALLAGLQQYLAAANLSAQPLPQVPEIQLWLLSDLFENQRLEPEVANALMEAPPYWVFCWGSGQVLARYLLDHRQQVAGKTVVDVGPGSGVVAIAAAMAGAARVIACDLDPQALVAVAANAELNGVQIETTTALAPALDEADLVTAADILYDRDNLGLLTTLRTQASVILADSRIRDLQADGYTLFEKGEACTWPDLSESSEFNAVRLYWADAEVAGASGSQATESEEGGCQ